MRVAKVGACHVRAAWPIRLHGGLAHARGACCHGACHKRGSGRGRLGGVGRPGGCAVCGGCALDGRAFGGDKGLQGVECMAWLKSCKSFYFVSYLLNMLANMICAQSMTLAAATVCRVHGTAQDMKIAQSMRIAH